MKLELLSPAGSMANLKAAVSKGADAVYLGMQRFSARSYATNFNEQYLKQATRICRSNNTNLYLTMNTLVKNHEIHDFFKQLRFAYSAGIDAVIIQQPSLIHMIKQNFPDLRIHISTQAGVMNSSYANLLSQADRINLARELTKDNISSIRSKFKKELEIFCHGALCVSVSGSCLFSSFLGGRSANRGRCAQPCRKKYDDCYYLSTKELCLIKQIPEIAKMKIDSIKIEGRMRSPFYVATVTEAYRKAIDSYYDGSFHIDKNTIDKLKNTFSREFTKGLFDRQDIFNRKESDAKTSKNNEFYKVNENNINLNRKKPQLSFPLIEPIESKKQLIVRVYNPDDAKLAYENKADIVCYDLFNKPPPSVPFYAVTPRIMTDKDIPLILDQIKKVKPDGILAGNMGILNLNLKIPILLDYNLNVFNDYDLKYHSGTIPIISPELSIRELQNLKIKNFAVLVHGKIRLMTLRHNLERKTIKDIKGKFIINKIFNGSEIINNKELGLLNKAKTLVNAGINTFYVDTEKNVANTVSFYRNLLDNNKTNDKNLKKNVVLGWSYKGVA